MQIYVHIYCLYVYIFIYCIYVICIYMHICVYIYQCKMDYDKLLKGEMSGFG